MKYRHQLIQQNLYRLTANWNEFTTVSLIDLPFKYLINAPMDGWCLLHAFVMAFKSVKSYHPISINKIRGDIINNFENFCNQNPGFFDSSEMNKYELVDYLVRKEFETDVVDLIPKLLSKIYDCQINIYEINRNVLVLENRNIFNSSILNISTPVINLLYKRDQSHYMAFLNQRFTTEQIVEMKHEIFLAENTDLLYELVQNPYFKEVAFNFPCPPTSESLSSSSEINEDQPLSRSSKLIAKKIKTG